MATIGIDLGTTYSCVGILNNNNVEIIANDQGLRTTPSYVAFTEQERLVGDAAKNMSSRNPKNTIYDAKRLIGRNFSDATVQNDMKLWPFKVIKGLKTSLLLKLPIKKKEFAAEEISSMLLVHLKGIAEAI